MSLISIKFFDKTFFIIRKFGFSKFILLGFLIISSLLLELLSIGLIIPVISILQDENFLRNFFNDNIFILNLDHSEQIFLIITILLTIFLLKFFFLIILNYYQNKYTSMIAFICCKMGGWMWWTAGLDRYGPAVWTAEPKIWTAELDRRNYCLVLCVKPILRSTEPVLWSILRSDPRSTPWSITNGFAHTPTHIYIPLHPCVMAMISHPCTMCSWCA